MPPSAGWTLMDAADALCAQQAWIYRTGGAELSAAMQTDLGASFSAYMTPDWWLSRYLLLALCDRPDLKLAGLPQSEGIYAKRRRIPYEQVIAARPTLQNLSAQSKVEVLLYLDLNEARLVIEQPRGQPSPRIDHLIGARIEVAGVRAAARERQAKDANGRHPAVAAIGVKSARRRFNAAAGRAWFRLFVDRWPEDQPPPNEAECWTAMQEYFDWDVPRAALRAIRRELAPASWLVRGRRKRRN
jgi:hypothetical protein